MNILNVSYKWNQTVRGLGFERKWVWLQRTHEGSGCDKDVLCLDGVSVSILVVTMYYSFAKCYL